MVNAPQELMLFLLNSESFILIKSFPNNNWNPVCNKLHWNNTSNTVWGHALHSHKWKTSSLATRCRHFSLKKWTIFASESFVSAISGVTSAWAGYAAEGYWLQWWWTGLAGSPDPPRASPGCETPWRGSSLAEPELHRCRTLTWRLPVRRKRQGEKTRGNAELHLINTSMNKVHKTAIFDSLFFGFILEIKCSLRILTPNHRQTLSVGGTDALQ